TVERAGGKNAPGTIHQRRGQPEIERAHAGRARDRARTAFKLAQQFLQRYTRGIVVTRIGRTLLLLREDPVEVLHGVVDIAGSRVDRRGGRDEVAGLAPVGPMDGFAFEFHCRFQRTPSLVSSRSTPAEASCARTSSARAKLRAFLAAV